MVDPLPIESIDSQSVEFYRALDWKIFGYPNKENDGETYLADLVAFNRHRTEAPLQVFCQNANGVPARRLRGLSGGPFYAGLAVSGVVSQKLSASDDVSGNLYISHLDANVVATLTALTNAKTSANGKLCPYPELAPFRAEQAEFFYGRENDIKNIYDHLLQKKWLILSGNSGAGKSSILRAGFARLSAEHPQFAEQRELLSPDKSLRTLIDQLHNLVPTVREPAPVLPGKPRLVLVDQLEQYLYSANLQSRQVFVAAVMSLSAQPGHVVLLALRADALHLLGDVLPSGSMSHVYNVAPLADDQVRDAIVRPAAKVGVLIDGALIEKLLTDMKQQSEVPLPFLQLVLYQLWVSGLRNRRIESKEYDTIFRSVDASPASNASSDGFSRVIGQHCSLALEKFHNKAARKNALQLCMDLVAFAEYEGKIKRYRKSLPNLEAIARYGHDVVELLINERLLTRRQPPSPTHFPTAQSQAAQESYLELTHDCLAEKWPELSEALDKTAEDRKYHDTDLLRRGQDYRAKTGGILDDPDLDRAERTCRRLTTSGFSVSPDVNTLITDSRKRKRKTSLIKRGLVLGLVGLAALAALAAAQSYLNFRRANDAQLVAEEALRSSRQSLFKAAAVQKESLAHLQHERMTNAENELARHHPQRALTYAAAAYELDSGEPEVRKILHQILLSLEGHRVINFHRGKVTAAHYSIQGDILLSASDDNQAALWEFDEGRRSVEPKFLLTGHKGEIWRADLSTNGAWVVTASSDGDMKLWDAHTGKRVLDYPRVSMRVPQMVQFNKTSEILVTASWDRIVRIWKLPQLKPQWECKGGMFAFSPDGQFLAVPDQDGDGAATTMAGQVGIYELSSGRAIKKLAELPSAPLALAYSPDGKLLFVASKSGPVLAYSLATGAVVFRLTDHPGSVSHLVVAPDGTQLFGLSPNGQFFIWALSAQGSRLRANVSMAGGPSQPEKVTAFAISPDSQSIALGGDHNTLMLTDLSGQEILSYEGYSQAQPGNVLQPLSIGIASLEFSPTGKTLLSARKDGLIDVWPVTGNQPLPLTPQRDHLFTDFSVSRDGSVVVALSRDDHF